MSNYDNTGTTGLWKNDKYEPGGKAPILKGHIYAHRDIKAGEKVAVAYWQNASDNERAPLYRGKVEDPYIPDQPTQAAQPTPSAPPVSDEIPF